MAGNIGRAQGRPEEIFGAQRVELRGIRPEQDVRGGHRVAHIRVRQGKLANNGRPVVRVHSPGKMGHVRSAARGRCSVFRGQHTQVHVNRAARPK